MGFERKLAARKTGAEAFRAGEQSLGFDLQDFWRWSTSDILSNATRGVLAEYLVARALGIAVEEGVRDEWAAYDLTTPEGVKIEVKSAAYLQSWYQERLSRISFLVAKTRTWDPATNLLDSMPARKADVYVLALLHHQDKATVNPMDVEQWCFYVLPTSLIDARTRSQHSITLPTLEQLGVVPTAWHELRTTVAKAALVRG